MLHNTHIKNGETLSQVYLDFASDSPRLSQLRQQLGPAIFKVLAAAYSCSSMTAFEGLLKLPQRSGKALLNLAVSTAAHGYQNLDMRSP